VFVGICLMIQSALGHCMMLYPVFDMFGAGFRRKFPLYFPWWRDHTLLLDKCFRAFWVIITCECASDVCVWTCADGMAIGLPKLEILIPLVGVTSGTLCAFVFPPVLHTIVFWRIWKRRGTLVFYVLRNGALVLLGIGIIITGCYANGKAIYAAFFL
jgi:hypothetical protein